MCGIAGIITADGSEPLRGLLTAMNESQAHRGPDQTGYLLLDGAGFGHRRLTILDPQSGRQPMQTEDGRYSLVYNGEIYNYRALNRELLAQGYSFEGHCDTETLLRAWQHWGEACIDRLQGMFAFAVWDASERRLYLVRDRIGIKPLYYAFTSNGDLIFGSELKALMVHPRMSRTINPQALDAYLALGYVPDPQCIFEAAAKLAPGHRLIHEPAAKRTDIRQYWDVVFEQRGAHSADQSTDLRERLEASVRARQIADVPLGAFLSGGVDSSAIVALMAGLNETPVNTCAISFDHGAFDESAYAARIAGQFRTDHQTRQVAADDFNLIDKLLGSYDEPFADSSALPTYRLCELARSRVKVALSGDGGDENFAGYRRYRFHLAESRARSRMPAGLRRPLFGTLARAYPKLDWAPQPLRAKTTFQSLAMDIAEGYCHGVSMIAEPLRDSLYSEDFKRQLQGYRVRSLFEAHAANMPDADPLSLAQYLDFKTYLPGDILTKVDRASMAHGLEVRVPFLDHSLVSWAATLPPASKLRGAEGKFVLKKAFESILPDDILYRPKMGFSVPLTAWFRGPLKEAARLAMTADDAILVQSGFFDPAALSRIYSQHVSGRRDHASVLWSLLMLARFLESEAGIRQIAKAEPEYASGV